MKNVSLIKSFSIGIIVCVVWAVQAQKIFKVTEFYKQDRYQDDQHTFALVFSKGTQHYRPSVGLLHDEMIIGLTFNVTHLKSIVEADQRSLVSNVTYFTCVNAYGESVIRQHHYIAYPLVEKPNFYWGMDLPNNLILEEIENVYHTGQAYIPGEINLEAKTPEPSQTILSAFRSKTEEVIFKSMNESRFFGNFEKYLVQAAQKVCPYIKPRP